jgi:ribose transport system ATP-binding protein
MTTRTGRAAVAAPNGEAATETCVHIRSVSKTFPGVIALNEVSMDVRVGEIHALVGSNGSGKSTLIKILAGIEHGDPGGCFEIGGVTTQVEAANPAIARERCIHVVHQDLGIFPHLSVAENIALSYGYQTGLGGRVRWRSLQEKTARLIDRFEIETQPDTLVSSLPLGAQTQIAIARALQAEEDDTRGLLILDEPTASLPAHEVDVLFKYLRRYASRGQAILYVSHRLDEVLDLADRVTVLRDGAIVGTFRASDLDEERLVELIVGRHVERSVRTTPLPTGTSPLLEIRGLTAGPLRDINLTVMPGEVLGIAGLLGSGRTELLRCVFGDLPLSSGDIRLRGAKHAPRRPRDAMNVGIAYVPENRVTHGVFNNLPVRDNIALAAMRQYWSSWRLSTSRMRADARRLMREFLVRAPDDDALLSKLSGGNQQKVVLARWLRRKPQLLLLDEPTQGVDVGARAEIYGLVRQAVEAGASAIVVASDLEELAQVSDRCIVLRRGRVIGEIQAERLDSYALTQMVHQKEGD